MNATWSRRHWLSLAGAGVVGTALFEANSAWAFRPSSRWLFDQAVARHLGRKINTLRVDQEVTFGAERRAVPVPGRVLVRAPEGLRVERMLPEGERVHVQGPRRERIVRPKEGEIKKKARPDLFYAFFTVGGNLERRAAAERLGKAAKTAKIDLDVVSYIRFDDRVNYLVGCKPWETEQKPAILLDKDTLVPTRIITFRKAAEGDVRIDVHLKGWGSAEGGSWFPKVIERYEAVGETATLVERAVTRTVERNESMDKTLFAVR